MAVAFPQVRVGEPRQYRGLSVFPLFTEAKESIDYILASEAIRDQMLTVQEVSEGGLVPELLVDNKGDRRVLFVEAEELVGAKQNRILNTSILIAAKSKTKIPVSCVEQGRWSYESKLFASSGSHSPSELRFALKRSVGQSLKRGARHSDQGQVWEKVGAMNALYCVESATGAMSDAFDAYREQVSEFQDKLQYVEGATGLAVAIGKKVVGCDLFDKPSTCQKLWGRLLSGVVFGAFQAKDIEAKATTADVEELLDSTTKAAWQPTAPIGEGEEWRAELSQGEQASALTFEDSLVHESVLVGG